MEEKNKLVPAYDARRGLSDDEVRRRISEGKVNGEHVSATRTYGEIVKSNVFTYFNLIFVILAVLLILVGSFRDLTFLGVIFFNTIIGIAQEIRSKRALDKLKIVSDPKAEVIRDGQNMVMPVEDLVLDDLIVLSAGSQIPADAVVVEGNVRVNEALITGESDEVKKLPGYELLSGSFIVSGTCRARLTAVGQNSYVSKLTEKATQDKHEEESEMIRALDKLVKIVGIIIIPIGITLFVQQKFFAGASFYDSVTGMVAAVIGMIPEGLYLLASVAMVVSIMRLARKQVLVRSMKCIETLARVNVLCVDKTGTITEDTMHVSDLIPLDGKDRDCVETLLSNMVTAMDGDNITMKAMKVKFTKGTGIKPDKVVSFSSKFKYSGCAMGGQSYVLGAPEFVLRGDFDKYKDLIEGYSGKGFRVLTFAKYKGELDGNELTADAEPLALVLLENPIRSTAKETFKYFAKQGVEIKVISGDNPVTVSRVAGEAGIPGADKYIDARELTSDQAIYNACLSYNVFGRVTPEQKRMFIKALKAQGKTVGMTGDGVNDILALKEAHCSIAMASGSDAASQVSQLVLVDSDFSKMPSVVAEGRRVVNNIERTASLFLVKNIFSLLLALFSMIAVNGYPMQPSQISLMGMFTIGIPAFFLSLEPNHNLIRGKFLPNVFRRAIPGGLTDFAAVTGLVIFGNMLGIEDAALSTACTVLVTAIGFMILLRVSRPMTTFHTILLSGLAIGWILCAVLLSSLFAMSAMPLRCVLLMLVFIAASDPILRFLVFIAEKTNRHT